MLTSPVKAPIGAACAFWPSTPTPSGASTSATSDRQVKVGATARSTSSSSSMRAARASANARASDRTLCIFQLPATNGVRASSRCAIRAQA